MPLADDLEDVRARIQADLKAGFDYFGHTKVAWRLVRRLSDEGHPVGVQNMDTGTVVDGPDLVGLSQGYVTGYLADSVFQHFVSLFEDFLFSLIRAWLIAHPAGIPNKEKKSVDLATVFDARDKGAIIEAVIDRELDELKYKRVAAWFRYLNDRVKLACPSADQVERLAEIKASRDILVHNRGVVNETYLDKAGPLARYEVGQRLEIPEPYLRETWLLIRDVVEGLSKAAVAKAG